jgi:hypothetical protein
MKNGLKILPLFIGLWILSGWALAASSTPSIHLKAADFDFGEVEEGEVISHDFLVRNNGSEVLEIKEVRPG